MKNSKVRLLSGDSELIIEAVLSDDEENTLKDYLEEVKRIVGNIPDPSVFNISLNIKAKIGEATNTELILPAERDVFILLHLVRPFILQKERLHFPRIANLLILKFKNAFFTGIIEKEKELFNGETSLEQIKVEYNGEVINSEASLLKYLNAFEYHRDKEKQEYFASLFGEKPDSLSMYYLYSVMLDKVKAIIGLGNIIRHIV